MSRDVGPTVSPTDEPMAKLLERIELAQEAGGIGIYDYDIARDRIAWDSRVRAIWGVGEDEQIDYATFTAGVHPEDLAQVNEAVAKSQDPSGDGRYFAHYRVIARDGSERVVEAMGRTTFENGVAVRLVGTVRDISDDVEARRELEDSKNFCQNLIDSAPTMLYIYDLVESRNIFIGPQIAPMTQMAKQDYEGLGKDLIPAVIHPDDLNRVVEHHKAIRDERIKPPFEIEYRLRKADGGWIWLTSSEVVHKRDPDGRPRQILGASLDITRRHEERELRNLLTRELEHRVKNAFAVVQSVAMMTLRNHCPRDVWKQFEDRLAALSHGQRLLTEKQWQSADLADIARQVFEPFATDDHSNIRIDGPSIAIEGSQVASIALVLHELATNAVKHGALSVENGHVDIKWGYRDHNTIIEWKEHGGPTVIPPTQTGFGSALIQSLGKNPTTDGIDYRADGLYCHLTL
jgi:PAS domain S-box-containing protein